MGCLGIAAGCRIGFDARIGATDASASSDGPERDGDGDGNGDGAGPAAIAHVKAFHAKLDVGNGTTQAFTAAALNAGDAVVFHVACKSTGAPTAVSLAAPSWTFTQLGPITGSAAAKWSASFGAIAPDTAAANFTISWTVANCTDRNHLADEFGNTDTGGGAITFDAHVETFGTGDCLANLTTAHDGAAVWGGCTSSLFLNSPGAGYTKGATDGLGDFAAYKITSDPAGTSEPFVITNNNSSNAFNLTAVTIKQR